MLRTFFCRFNNYLMFLLYACYALTDNFIEIKLLAKYLYAFVKLNNFLSMLTEIKIWQ